MKKIRTKPKQQKRPYKPGNSRLSKILKLALLSIVVLVILLSLFKVSDFLYKLENPNILRVENIYLNSELKSVNIKRLSKFLTKYNQKPIMYLDLKEIKQQIEAFPWVKTAIVSRKLPNTIEIKIHENNLVGLFYENGIYYPISDDGKIIEKSAQFNPKIPVVKGEEANKHISEYLEILSALKPYHVNVKTGEYVGKRRWNLIFKDGVKVKLPEENYALAAQKLKELQRQEKILDRKIKEIDLRFKDKTLIRQ
jgi:cell division protein FtsQ